ncbi:hypothetical protein SAMN05192584_103176 [Streptomyces pini]|uniref:DUF3558 domain-containing protein n=1 Tax=Streptomyces pini TaxID=1520580 RepID=A0A1I3W7M5_9ACTN|nr:hypothetical protein SAMN05192584_103176 [Streptomyces pini]
MKISGGYRVAILFLATLISVTGCGTAKDEREHREYTVPESLCSMDLDAEMIEPFLPPGKEIDQTEETDRIDWFCRVSVDDKSVFMLTWEWWEPNWSAERFAVRQAYATPDRKSADGSYVHSKEDAVAVVRCTERGEKWDIFLTARVRNGGIPNADAMEKFIVAYRDDFLKSDPCADMR